MSSTNPTRENSARPLIGVLGAGQLGRMLALAGHELGLRFLFVDPSPESPAGEVGELLKTDYDDPLAVERLAGCDLVTYEFENVSLELVRRLAERVPVFPPPAALEVSQDRLHEKRCFSELGIPTAPYFDVDSEASLVKALAETGYPAVLKTRRLGYDGKGQAVLRSPADATRAFAELGQVPLVLEGFMAFERELSVIGARGRSGQVCFYPLFENHHQGGILRLSLSPAPDIDVERQRTAEHYLKALFERLDYTGVLTLELFQKDGRFYANEIAPRVHNSGHHTIEGAVTSQFENHLRAILGLPLGSTALVGSSAMLNCIGSLPDPRAVLGVSDAHFHAYGKHPRPGRKVGHLTVRAREHEALAEKLAALRRLVWPVE